MRKRFSSVAVLVLMLWLTVFRAFAAEPEVPSVPPSVPPITVYPAEVRATEERGVYYLEKIYYLTAGDDPAGISTEDFFREGKRYVLVDILKNDMTETDTRDYMEVITLETDTQDLARIIQELEPQLEVSTDEGYVGILRPDYTSIKVEASGYGTSSWTASTTRTFPNLSDADISSLPKTTEDSGRTLSLADVDWQESTTDIMDGEAVAVRYTAVATYTGLVTGMYATGYTATVNYYGQVTKTSSDTIIYTAVFEARPEETAEPVTPAPEPTPAEEQEPMTHVSEPPEQNRQPEAETHPEEARKLMILTLACTTIVLVLGYGGYLILKLIKKSS